MVEIVVQFHDLVQGEAALTDPYHMSFFGEIFVIF